ncbi:hypothetical protein [Parerythrobacter jejuensis]|uniref:Lipoprotein n=1 Tax=Parerythrobacter jejuensis TaxID=795812 RepID=A0A845ATD9_9SPHN|nr:hypothetical protein [Parerythrobacter jejuensis]MXP32864.1 hypothetical protein [Parerythrobacter jejuensis]
MRLTLAIIPALALAACGEADMTAEETQESVAAEQSEDMMSPDDMPKLDMPEEGDAAPTDTETPEPEQEVPAE